MNITDVDRLLMEVTTSRSRRIRNHLATTWMYGSLIIAVVPLGFVLWTLIQRGASSLSVDWFTKDLPAIIKRARADSEKMGIRVVGVWLTLGEYDMIAVVDAPDDKTLAARLLITGEAGNATSQTMRAFSEAEFAEIVSKLP